jgi:hypothetical protein
LSFVVACAAHTITADAPAADAPRADAPVADAPITDAGRPDADLVDALPDGPCGPLPVEGPMSPGQQIACPDGCLGIDTCNLCGIGQRCSLVCYHGCFFCNQGQWIISQADCSIEPDAPP